MLDGKGVLDKPSDSPDVVKPPKPRRILVCWDYITEMVRVAHASATEELLRIDRANLVERGVKRLRRTRDGYA